MRGGGIGNGLGTRKTKAREVLVVEFPGEEEGRENLGEDESEREEESGMVGPGGQDDGMRVVRRTRRGPDPHKEETL